MQKAKVVKCKRPSELVTLHSVTCYHTITLDFGMLISKALKEYPLIIARRTVYKEGRVCLWCEVTVCVPVVLRCESAREDMTEGQREKERAEEIKSSECVWVRDREMKAWEEMVRFWHRRWQLSAAAFHRAGIPHKPATLYIPTIPVCACAHWVIHYSNHCNSCIVRSCLICLPLVSSPPHKIEMKILNFK